MEDSKAVRPSSFINNIPSFLNDKKAEEKGIGEEERMLYSMSCTIGWEIYKEYLENLTRELEELISMGASSGLSFEEIGKNAIVVSLTKDILKKTLNKVDDAREAVLNEK